MFKGPHWQKTQKANPSSPQTILHQENALTDFINNFNPQVGVIDIKYFD